MTTKILALTDALGNLVRFRLMPGHRFDSIGVAPLIERAEFGAFIADKGFDSNDIVADLNERGAKIASLSIQGGPYQFRLKSRFTNGVT